MTPPMAGPPAACCSPRVGLSDALDAARLAGIAGALASPVRVQILDVLIRSDAEVCQCELATLFDLGQPALSHHLRRLVGAGLVTVERRHRWAWYSVDRSAVDELTQWLA